MKRRFFTLFAVMMATLGCMAQQKFVEEYKNVRYKFVVKGGDEVAIVGLKGMKKYEVIICDLPSTIKHGGQEYKVTEIGDKTFKEAYHIKSLFLPTGLKRIGKKTFSKCIRLKNVTFPDSIEVIDDKAFFGTPIADVYLPQAIRTVGKEAFCAHSANHVWISVMKHLDVPETCETIGKHAFSSYKNGISDWRLTDTDILSMPEWVTLENCESLGLAKKALKRIGRVEAEPEEDEQAGEKKLSKKEKKALKKAQKEQAETIATETVPE